MRQIKDVWINPPKAITILVGLILAVLPWSEKVTTWCIIFLAFFLLFEVIFRKRVPKLEYKHLAITSLIFIISLFGLLNTEAIEVGGKYIERISSGILFPVLFMVISQKFTFRPQRVFYIFLASCILRYLVFLCNVVDLELVFIWDYWKEVILQFNQFFKEGALHPTYFSLYLGFCALICLHFIPKSRGRRNKFLWVGLLFLLIVFNFSLGAKMPFIALLIAMIIGIWLYARRHAARGRRRKYTWGLLSGMAMLMLILFAVPNSISQDIKNYYDLFLGNTLKESYDYDQLGTTYSFETWSKTNRVYIWRSAMNVFEKHAFFGVGTGDIQTELNSQYGKDGQEYLARNSANTHNQYLDYLIKFGLFGFLLIGWVFYKYLRRAITYNNVLYTTFLVLILGTMLTENILNRQMGIIFFFLWNSLFYFSSNIKERIAAN